MAKNSVVVEENGKLVCKRVEDKSRKKKSKRRVPNEGEYSKNYRKNPSQKKYMRRFRHLESIESEVKSADLTLTREIYNVKRWSEIYTSDQPKKSRIKGIEAYTGEGKDIGVLLEENFDFEKIAKEENYKLEKESGTYPAITYRLEKKGRFGISRIVLQSLMEGTNYVGIRKGITKTPLGIGALGLYLKNKYGKIKFKNTKN